MSKQIVKKAQLEAVVLRINKITNNPLTTYTRKDDGKLVSNVGNYHLDFAYGGIQLRQIDNERGGSSDVLRIGFVPKRELLGAMFAFIEGLERSKERGQKTIS